MNRNLWKIMKMMPWPLRAASGAPIGPKTAVGRPHVWEKGAILTEKWNSGWIKVRTLGAKVRIGSTFLVLFEASHLKRCFCYFPLEKMKNNMLQQSKRTSKTRSAIRSLICIEFNQFDGLFGSTGLCFLAAFLRHLSDFGRHFGPQWILKGVAKTTFFWSIMLNKNEKKEIQKRFKEKHEI